MLLLFAPLDAGKPVSPGVYRRLQKALTALGPGNTGSMEELDQRELLRLGLSPAEADNILERLSKKQELERHLDTLWRLGVTVLTRISPGYPQRLRQVLGDRAPMLLYCVGNLCLLEEECVSLVGSRRLRAPGRYFAQCLGQATAQELLVCVSGGAAGADTAAVDSALDHGGGAVVFLADSLQERMMAMRPRLQSGRLLLVSEDGFDQSFSTQRAYSRNRLIHAMGQKTFVAQSDYGRGGTWNGVMENLKYGWSPVFMCASEPDDPGTRGLLERGCNPLLPEELHDLRTLEPGQTSLFPV